MKLFEKTYCAEEIADLGRDVSECFDSDFNEAAASIPVDKHGFYKGTCTVTIVFTPDNCGAE